MGIGNVIVDDVLDNNYIGKLVDSYNKKRKFKPSIFDTKPKSPRELVIENMKTLSFYLVENKAFVSRKGLKMFDTIDYSKSAKDSNCDKSDMPRIKISDEEYEELVNNWYLMIPPFEMGVLRINKNRYLWFEITDINPDSKTYSVSIVDYALHSGIWLVTDSMRVTNLMTGDKFKYSIKGYVGFYDILTHYLDDGKLQGMSDREMDFLKEVTLPFIKERFGTGEGLDAEIENICAHFSLAIVKTNLDILHSRPKIKKSETEEDLGVGSSTSGAKVKSVAGDVPDKQPPHIIRTFKSGISIVSRKPPKFAAKEIIRKYTKPSWKTIGHTRHYKSGKVVYICPSIHHRKCLKGGAGEGSDAPRTVIVVERKENEEAVS